MKPVVQTITSVEEGGNCLAACLASLLEMPIAVVPNAALIWRDGDDEDVTARGWALVRDWLETLGLDIWNMGDGDDWRPEGYHLGIYLSPRLAPATHIVVCEGSEIVWDPHPAAAEQPVDPSTLRSIYVLAVRDPMQLVRALNPSALAA